MASIQTSHTPDDTALLRSLYTQLHAVQIRLQLPTLRFLSVDDSIGAITSIPRAAWLRSDFWDLHLHPDDRIALRLAMTKAQSSMSPLETRVRVAVDATEYLRVRLVCTRDDGRSLRGFLVPAHERTQQRSVNYYRDRLAVATETAAVYLAEVDAKRRVERADDRLSALLGVAAGELLTLDEWLAAVVADDRAILANHYAAALQRGAPHSIMQLPAIEYRMRCRDDRVVSLRRETRVWRGRGGLPERIIAAIQEIGDSAAVAAAPAAATLATDAMLDAIPGFAAVLDARGTVVAANDAWRAAEDRARFASVGTNYRRALKRRMADGAKEAEPLVASLEKVLAGKTHHIVTDHPWPAHGAAQRWTFIAQRLERRGGALVIHRPTLATQGAAELSILGQSTDRVVQLAIAGELLSSITHDLRQPLAALRMNLAAALELARRSVPDDPEVAASITDAIAQEERVAHKLAVVQDLVAHRTTVNEPVDLAALAEEVVRIAKSESVARRVPFQTNMSADLPPVLGDRRLIRAAVLGLVLDAFGALNATAPTRVSLTTHRVNTDHVEVGVCRFADDAPPSADWVLTIARAVAEVESVPIMLDSDGKTRSCVRLRWRVHKGSDAEPTTA